MTHEILLLRCYTNLQERLDLAGRLVRQTDYEPSRRMYEHEMQRIRERMGVLRDLAKEKRLRLEELR